MKLKKQKDAGSEEFMEAWAIYESSFPLDEKRTLKAQKEIMKKDQYSFFAVLEDKVVIALISQWDFESFLLVEHLAVKNDLRGKGIGTEIMDRFILSKGRTIVLEVQRPDTEIATKRIQFYQNSGFKLNHFDYIQPSYGSGKNPVPMYLMTYPSDIDSSEFSEIREKLHKIVYGLKEPLIDY